MKKAFMFMAVLLFSLRCLATYGTNSAVPSWFNLHLLSSVEWSTNNGQTWQLRNHADYISDFTIKDYNFMYLWGDCGFFRAVIETNSFLKTVIYHGFTVDGITNYVDFYQWYYDPPALGKYSNIMYRTWLQITNMGIAPVPLDCTNCVENTNTIPHP